MDLVQNSKSSVLIGTPTSAQTATHVIDTIGFDAVSVDAIYRSVINTAAPALVRFETSDDNTTYATVSGLVQGTDFSPAGVANTADANVTRFDVSTRALGRYVRLSVTPATANGTTQATVIFDARLHKAEKGVSSASDAGVQARVVK